MKLKDLLREITPTRLIGSADGEITGICYDSRKVTPGSLFVAIRGFQSDGHAYIPSALEKGASALVVEDLPEDLPDTVTCVQVPDSRAALARLGAVWHGHPEKQLKLIGVTGTNGKTTVTHLIRHILEKNGEKCGLIGTNGIYFGDVARESARTTPESLELYGILREMADAGMTCAAMEVSSHSLALDRVLGLTFAAAAFTNLTQDHLDFHGTMEEYFRAKSLLFDRCRTAVINLDDDWGTRLAGEKTCEKITFSARSDAAELVAKNVQLLPDGIRAVVVRDCDIARLRLGIPGQFSVYNALTAAGCCMALGLSLEQVCDGLADAPGIKGRAEIVPTGRDFTVMIDYSHTPDSMENILRTVRGYAKGRVVGLFGAGGDRDRAKRPLMGKAAAEGCDLAIVTSDNPRSEDPQAIIDDILAGMDGKTKRQVIPDRREAIAWAVKNAKKDDIIVLMGKGQETYQEIGGQKLHLDEREEVAKALTAL
ncbi:MAG: UDP-N-acetylmuramoyl-L-alanyl-D-glutamate--2,6-diaminopimelate ligase [Clostridia bacterium]|nr:UDP-N-acetylmuramoyl-L-alanyl-D-glutamate--2,6-diaminopimelate ligase [Clostridia bacterium]